ncbi:MAG: type II toxin-antitoxin system RelE/ParE family toxin [Glaciecola sp.]|jgi:toxin ParE1/3/4|nr:type II toxin-antitoxin system RelE/ParE family toxin [Glaciecola sp.]MDG1816016.1 type II toxin-antitoxin system RelE/ParE family toxin [Glaciecola sp.]MDG2098592.1 type II toxin-antitoxin system RelE/ParE family toxin [Glaciecola sp.]
MQNSEYKLSKLAQIHLRKIKSYTITNFSEMHWHDYRGTLLSGFQMLAENPDVGKSCDDLYPNGFYFPIGRHTAYFIKEECLILIVAVLGQSQLPQKHLK